MPQSLAKVYLHLVFSTKNRERLLPDPIRPNLHSYIGGILNGLGCTPIEINSEPDHTHILFIMSRTQTISDVVGHIKKSSNDWLREQSREFSDFYWQAGYAIFSVSQSNVEDVRQYIRTQRDHHGRVLFPGRIPRLPQTPSARFRRTLRLGLTLPALQADCSFVPSNPRHWPGGLSLGLTFLGPLGQSPATTSLRKRRNAAQELSPRLRPPGRCLGKKAPSAPRALKGRKKITSASWPAV